MRWRKNSGDNSDDHGSAPAEPSVTPPGPDTKPAPTVPAEAPPGDRASVSPFGETEEPRKVDVEVPLDLGAVDPVDLERATRRAVARALAEDLGDRGDVTSLATIPPGMAGTAELVARGDGVVAGASVVTAVFDQVDARVQVELKVQDGDKVVKGDVLGAVTGPLRSILTGERTALNFLCHLSGIATRTAAFVDAAAGTGCAIRDTRKTTPGLRLLEKAAVKAGGGHNHRVGLYDAILVKDNHVAAAGGIAAAAAGALSREGVHVQVEVMDLNQLEQALEAGVTDILLDNFTPEEIRQAIQRVGGRAALEASGNITLDNVRSYANTGVERVAIGAITHSAPNLDIALDIRADELESPGYLSSVWTSEVPSATAAATETAAEPQAGDAASEDASDASDADSDDPAAELTEDRQAEGAISPEEGAAADTDADDAVTVAGFAPETDQADAADASDVSDESEDASDDAPEQLEGGALFAWRERQLGGDDGQD